MLMPARIQNSKSKNSFKEQENFLTLLGAWSLSLTPFDTQRCVVSSFGYNLQRDYDIEKIMKIHIIKIER